MNKSDAPALETCQCQLATAPAKIVEGDYSPSGAIGEHQGQVRPYETGSSGNQQSHKPGAHNTAEMQSYHGSRRLSSKSRTTGSST